MAKDILEALKMRRSIKIFSDKKIDKDDMNIIIEAGRLSPSSFGLEHWKFLVITNSELKEKLKPLCYNQPQVSSCSHLVVILARLDFKEDSEYLDKCLKRFGKNYEAMKKIINSSISNLSDEEIKHWSISQTYIAGANMMLTASYLGIDSCPMEGFNAGSIVKELNIDSEFAVSLLIPFGYREKEPHPQMRWDVDDIVEYIN